MPKLSEEGTRIVQDLAQRHNLSTDAVTHMLIAVNNGNGTMAQFGHPEFGGSGQWMRGGMTMVSDLFNHQLKSRVDNLCNDLSNALANHQLIAFSGSSQSQSQGGNSAQSQASGSMGSTNSLFVPDPTTNWWPTEFGPPAAIGSQNNLRYAYFPAQRRLAVTTGGDVWVYDTMDHQIGGFGQQQGVGGSITLTSQYGTVNLSTLPVISRCGVPQQPTPDSSLNAASTPPAPDAPAPVAPSPGNSASGSSEPTAETRSSVPATNAAAPADAASRDAILETLDRLGGLKEKGYITDEEFAAKKAELLARL
ncbi:SHOCT domain-containing protein [Aureliella helgolandensis]|uniref:SHOCT domain-containing protein n=1 Tax=Aureliella helgolandensis TaxID=2527968 RepID=A0A518G320_9BACT|nr:SHOCT domain-containing protein [Aureliella helgolandensis]QDV22992.1 hypothetical protein Q31a_12850 [Aureliella helgolandensis]